MVLQEIGENSTARLIEVSQKLIVGRKSVLTQCARYELQKKRIELLRLQNYALPFLDDLSSFNFEQTDTALQNINSILLQVGNLKSKILSSVYEEVADEVLPEKENLLSQLDETHSSGEKLRETIITKQAAHTLQGFEPIRDSANQISIGQNLAEKIETFNIQTTLTDFSEAFDKLESEYQRLKTENEIGQNLLTL